MVEATFEQAYPIAARAAKVRATAAVVSGAIPVADREDFEQEGLTACWRALPQFDPARASLRTFIERVIASRIASLVRAARRSPARVSLSAAGPQPVDSGAELAGTLRRRRAALIGVRMPRPAVDSPAAGTLARGGRPDAGHSSLHGPRPNPPAAPQVRRGWLRAERRPAMNTHSMSIVEVRCDAVHVGERHRKDLGEMEVLAASIATEGLLQPIGITEENILVFGERRLLASGCAPSGNHRGAGRSRPQHHGRRVRRKRDPEGIHSVRTGGDRQGTRGSVGRKTRARITGNIFPN